MKLNMHHVFAGLTAATIGGGALALAAHSNPAPGGALANQFTPSDRTVFTQGFRTSGGTCNVGFAERGLCFEASHLESRIVEGERFPADMYPLALEWRVTLAMARKADHLKTVRIGRTLALVDRETGIVADTIRLGDRPETEMAQVSRAS